jgi:cytochrome c
MTRVRAVVAGCVVALTASLLLARVHPFGNAGLYAPHDAENSIMDHSLIPAEVRSMLTEKCADCHSFEVRAPIYGRFAPMSWLMERDIVRGRAAMNLSQWDSYSPDQQQTLAAKIVRETREHQMPLPQYRLIHWDSRITEDDKEMLAAWARATWGTNVDSAGQPSAEGDSGHGKEVFEKRCSGCHSLTQNHQGPHLQGVYGRTAGTAEGYAYSPALKKARIVWDEQSLEKWLTDPDAFIPGNNMDFQLARPQEHRDVISYLRQVSGK